MKLSLGPLPNTQVVRLSVALPQALKQELDRYAEIHSKTFGTTVDAQTLIPQMLALFLQRDRVFRRAKQSRDRRDDSHQ